MNAPDCINIDINLKAIFGARIPADVDVALEAFDRSSSKPVDPAQLAALRDAVVQHAGQRIERLEAAARELTVHSVDTTDEHQPGVSPATLQMSQAVNRSAPETAAPRLERAVSMQRARELFDSLATADDIPHDFIDEGCMFRAHVMAKRLEEAGVFSEKIILSPTAGDLRINSDKAAIGFTLAMFHIAPAIYVKTDAGKIERRVIDPSLCDGPATQAQWASHMEALGGAPCKTDFASRFVLMPYEKDDPPTTWKQRDLDDATAWNEQYKEVEKQMRESGFAEHLRELVARSEAGENVSS